ncbi:MAG: alpha/beta fold hydrolase [Deltaproteobacteria bacterium]|nr:alpha/beta fold hydrolase [Deltaproteobacteria bacterium]MDQ3297288.1 alpha/beta hydrolase [Myxococcota bacterium]
MARRYLLVMLVAFAATPLFLASTEAAPRNPPKVARHLAPKPRWQTLPLPPPMPAATTSGTVEVGDVRIYFATYGTGAPVILLHGGLGNADHFAFQVPALAAKYQVIAIDSRGQGRSTLSKQPLSYHVMAGDVLAVMDHLKVTRAALFGWSDGGVIALDLAIEHPERVSRLFVLGTNYHSSGSKPRKGASPPTFTAYAAKCKTDYHRLSKTPKAYGAMVSSLLPIWRRAGGFTKDQMRSIKAPTVVADGDHDEIVVLDHLEEMALLIPDARLVVFKDTSHFALWQDPEAVTAAVLEFLAAP